MSLLAYQDLLLSIFGSPFSIRVWQSRALTYYFVTITRTTKPQHVNIYWKPTPIHQHVPTSLARFSSVITNSNLDPFLSDLRSRLDLRFNGEKVIFKFKYLKKCVLFIFFLKKRKVTLAALPPIHVKYILLGLFI